MVNTSAFHAEDYQFESGIPYFCSHSLRVKFVFCPRVVGSIPTGSYYFFWLIAQWLSTRLLPVGLLVRVQLSQPCPHSLEVKHTLGKGETMGSNPIEGFYTPIVQGKNTAWVKLDIG